MINIGLTGKIKIKPCYSFQYSVLDHCDCVIGLFIFLYCRVFLETDVFNGGELPAVWPTSSAGEREDLDQDVGGCDQGWATGAVPAEQWTGKS